MQKKRLINIAVTNQIADMLNKSAKIDVKELISDFEKLNFKPNSYIKKSKSLFSKLASYFKKNKNEESKIETTFILGFGENAGVFSSSISAGLALTAIRSLGANSYAEMKRDKIYKGLKAQIKDIKRKIPDYNDPENLNYQLHNQIILKETLNHLSIEPAFLNCQSEEKAMGILNDTFLELKKSSGENEGAFNTHSNWGAFKTTQSGNINYGNIIHDNMIKKLDAKIIDFEKNHKISLEKLQKKLNKMYRSLNESMPISYIQNKKRPTKLAYSKYKGNCALNIIKKIIFTKFL